MLADSDDEIDDQVIDEVENIEYDSDEDEDDDQEVQKTRRLINPFSPADYKSKFTP